MFKFHINMEVDGILLVLVLPKINFNQHIQLNECGQNEATKCGTSEG